MFEAYISSLLRILHSKLINSHLRTCPGEVLSKMGKFDLINLEWIALLLGFGLFHHHLFMSNTSK